ncbi:MAG: sulfotransferase [Gammaproteobacteria bacterium]|jgi:hypothetical protein
MFERTVFLLSPSYHGATLLAKLLNAHPEITALGDTLPSNEFDQVCGCGETVSRCRFWRDIEKETGAKQFKATRRNLLAMYPGETGGRMGRLLFSDFLSFWATPGVIRRFSGESMLTRFRAEFRGFLSSVHRHTRDAGTVFVDGAKYVSRVAALTAANEPIEGVIHLYRDPGDFVASSIRNTGRGGLLGLLEHALRYRLYHARARQMGRAAKTRIDVSYEMLTTNGDEELDRIFRFLQVCPMTVTELQARMDRQWHFMGNASLLSFDGKLRASRHSIPIAQRWLIRLLAGASR